MYPASCPAAKEAEREEQRWHWQRDLATPFTGALTGKSKADLQDIAQVLGLTIDGQKKDVLARINAHFNANPVLRDDLRFGGLFNRTRWPMQQTEDETSNMTTAASSRPSVPLSFPPPPAPLSSNIVNTHLFSGTSHPSTSMIRVDQVYPPYPYVLPLYPTQPPLPH